MPPRRKPQLGDDVRASLAAPLERLAGLDPFDLLRRSQQVLDALLEAQADVGALRRGAVRQLRADGYLLKEIAEQIGTTPQRVHQISHGYDRHERKNRESLLRKQHPR